MEARPAIPAEVKRILRQESGFGCVVCGHPFIEYHHIVPWANEQHYRPEDMMVLCPNHHHVCTAGAINIQQQREWKQNPKNIADGLALGVLFVESKKMVVKFGGGIAIDTPNLLTVRDRPIVGTQMDRNTGQIYVNAHIFDRNGRQVGVLYQNEWSIIAGRVWDFEVHPKWAAVRNHTRDIAFSVDCRGDAIKLTGKWSFGGVPVEFGPNKAMVGTNEISGNTIENCVNFIHLR